MSEPRFYAESDGEGGSRAFYIIDRYGDPMGDRRTDVLTDQYYSHKAGMRRARKIAKEFNENPPYPVWDDIQARREGYAK